LSKTVSFVPDADLPNARRLASSNTTYCKGLPTKKTGASKSTKSWVVSGDPAPALTFKSLMAMP
jgi:hypothetical protein